MFYKYVTVSPILFLFSSGYKRYNFVYFVLVIWCCLGIISYEIDIIFLGGFVSLFFLSKVWITIWNNLHTFFLNDLFSWKFLKNRKHKTFRLRKYVNVLCLPPVNTVTVLYAFYEYLFSLMLDSPFCLYILLCMFGKRQQKPYICLSICTHMVFVHTKKLNVWWFKNLLLAKKVRDTVFLGSEFASLTYANLIFFHFYDWNGKDSILK